MSTNTPVVREMEISESSSVDQKPGPVAFIDAALVRLPAGYPHEPIQVIGLPAAPRSLRPTYGPLVVEQDEDGQIVVQDVAGAVYGVGDSLEEAQADFLTALRDHMAFLRSHFEQLSAHLQGELGTLEKLFPNV